MSETTIRISYVRARFAADLLAGCRSSLLKITDLLQSERELATAKRRQSGERAPEPEYDARPQVVAAALYAEWIVDALHRQIFVYFQADAQAAALFRTAGDPQLPPIDATPVAAREWLLPPMPGPLPRREDAGLPEGASLRVPIERELRSICEDIDDAIRAINWSRNVRFQQEIIGAVTNLRDWADLSATAIARES